MAIKKNKPRLEPTEKGNIYDKVFKENSEDIFLPLVEKRLKIQIKYFKPLREKMQTTLEREMDLFYKVVTTTNEKFILHLEFQTQNDLEMVYRVGEHHGIAQRRTKLKIRHVVVYLGTETPTMRTELLPEEVYIGFELINVSTLDTESLLSSQLPRVILLAILSNYDKKDQEVILRTIVTRLRIVCKNATELSKYIKQLIILSRLRKAEDLTVKITSEMPITYDIEQDYLYKQGTEKGVNIGKEQGINIGKEQGINIGKEQGINIGKEQGINIGKEQGINIGKEQGINIGKEQGIVLEHERMLRFVVKNLIKSTDFDNEKIASLAGAGADFVQKMLDELVEQEQSELNNTTENEDNLPISDVKKDHFDESTSNKEETQP
jgi:hypothetical protein